MDMKSSVYAIIDGKNSNDCSINLNLDMVGGRRRYSRINDVGSGRRWGEVRSKDIS